MIDRIISQTFQIGAERPAIEFDGCWWTWAELWAVGAELDRLLAEAGIGAGARVGCVMRNRPGTAAAIVSLIVSGRCIVTLNPMYRAERLRDDVVSLAPDAVVAMEEDWADEWLRGATAASGALGLSVPSVPTGPARIAAKATETWAGPAGAEDERVALEMLTSGTTGPPKRIKLRYRTVERAVLDAGVYDGRGSEPKLRGGTSVLSAPFAHIAGVFGLLNNLSAGRKVALLDRFTVPGWVDAVSRHRPRVASAPPSALRMILDADVPKEALDSLTAVRTGSAPLDPALGEEFEARYGIPVLQNYSATEFAGAGAGWTLDDHRRFSREKRGAVGRVNPAIEARIIDPQNGTSLPYGQQGLLELRAAHLGDGTNWVRTTDLAVLDEDDFLWIRGRADNAIVRGGFKITPDEVVRALETHPAVREAAVVGMPDRRLGQIPVAAYTVRAGFDVPDEDAVKEHLRGILLPYQVPDRVHPVDALPRTPSMKVSQPALIEMLSDLA